MDRSIHGKRIEMTLYILSTLIITWVLALVMLRRTAEARNMILIIMFIPSITALIFQKIYNAPIKQYLRQSVLGTSLKSVIFATAYPLLFIGACAVISLIIGLGQINMDKALSLNRFINFILNSILTLLPALGEEYGWRGYLLPELTKMQGKIKSMILLGIVWVLYHIPVIYVLAKIDISGNPIVITLIQACSLFVLSFSFSYCYYISKSIISVTIIHSLWNSANTWILGDIFSHKTAMISGNVFYINGEGLIGLCLGIISMAVFIKKLRAIDKVQDDVIFHS